MSPSINTMAGSPAMGWQSGETPRQWQQRLLAERQSREKQPTPAAMSATKPKAEPADAYRQQAAKIVAELGAERGEAYVAAGMSYAEALAAEHKKLTAEREQLTADAGKRERKAKRFAGRFNAFGSKHKQRAEAAE